MSKIKFEAGKYYKHTTGEKLSVIGEVDTFYYGKCLVAESNKKADLIPIFSEFAQAVNWKEITREEWMRG